LCTVKDILEFELITHEGQAIKKCYFNNNAIRARISEMTFYLQGPLMDVLSNKHTRLNKLKGLNVTLAMW